MQALLNGGKINEQSLASSAFNQGTNTKKPKRITFKDRFLALTSSFRCLDCHLGLDALKDNSLLFKLIEKEFI